MGKYLPIHEAQTEMFRWLESLGHTVYFGPEKTIDPLKRSEDWTVWKMCKRKRRFVMRPEEDSARRVYACPHCEGWHFTRR